MKENIINSEHKYLFLDSACKLMYTLAFAHFRPFSGTTFPEE
jgi:hypothetical protein